MIGESYNPVERYAGEFRETFRRHAQDFFEALVKRSQVDVEENIRLVNEHRKWKQEAESADRRRTRFGCLAAVFVVLCLAALGIGLWVYLGYPMDVAWIDANRVLVITVCLLVLLFGCTLLFSWIFPRRKQLAQMRDAALQKSGEFLSQAKAQMAPLNRLYNWEIPARLIEQTMPDIRFDRFSHQKRLEQFTREFGWSGEVGDATSVLFAQSGELAENPFVFCKLLSQRWRDKVYTGSLTIHWTTVERNVKGRRCTRHHTETLTASVTKPEPCYHQYNMLAYGNDAAPNLSFKRACSGLAQENEGFWGKQRQRSHQKELEKFSRNLEDESQYTMMANKEFETLFDTMNRDNETEIRMMFTPLAQAQMLQLLKDTKTGFGDDFKFVKERKMNFICATHLNECELDTNPGRFRNYDLKAAEKFFIDWNCDYFHKVYFALAPLLAIPLYMQTEPESKLQAYPELALNSANGWECESFANFMGEKRFAHPASVTRNILKVSKIQRRGTESTVQIAAYGYKTVEHTEYVTQLGGDGRLHNVPVKWLEYVQVRKNSIFNIAEQIGNKPSEKPADVIRRGIQAFFSR